MNAPLSRASKDVILPLICVVAVLYLAKDFLIPLALAILLSFLFAPLVRRFERLHLGRIGSVLLAVALGFAVIGGVGYVVGGQLIDLANDLPRYEDNLKDKVHSLKSGKNDTFSKATQTLRDVTNEMSSPEAAPAPGAAGTPPAGTESAAEPGSPPAANPGQAAPQAQAGSAPPATQAAPTPAAVPVQVVENPGNAFQTLRDFARPLLGPLGTAAIVIIFVIFILLEREDLRDRIIHLMGRAHLQTTTQALDEAGARVTRYLIAQLIVNVTYGIPVGVGLYFLGIPNAILWGMLATVLRFIPYIGPWMAAAFPLALSLAVSKGWTTPLWTLALFLVLELVSNNVVEPWLYGSSTGLSPMAVIVAATFWTWLWGTTGLLLATPLTVCIAVLGKYIPSLTFLDVLLGDLPPIAAGDRFYQRLLARDEEEVCSLAEEYTEKHSLTETFEAVIVPAMRLADIDFHSGTLTELARHEMLEIVRDVITDLGAPPVPVTPPEGDVGTPSEASVLCVPAGDEADEICALMLARVLALNGVTARVIPCKLLASEMLEACAKEPARNILVSVLPPGSSRQATYVTKRLRERFPKARIMVGLWGEPAGDDRRIQRFRRVEVDGVFTTLLEASKEIAATATTIVSPPPTEAAAA